MRNVLALAALAGVVGCGMANGAGRDGGPMGQRSFSVGAFQTVALGGSDTVRVVRGPAVSVTATGPQAVLDQLDIRVDGDTLKIGRKGSWHWGYSKGAVITVTTPGIRGAAIGGSGDMSVDRIDGDRFEGSVGGSGSLDVAAAAVRAAEISVGGSGNIRIAGTSESAKLSVGGSGSIDAGKLLSQRAELAIGGSGDIRAAATQSAAMSVAGSGSAFVKGTDRCTISKTGSGQATCER